MFVSTFHSKLNRVCPFVIFSISLKSVLGEFHNIRITFYHPNGCMRLNFLSPFSPPPRKKKKKSTSLRHSGFSTCCAADDTIIALIFLSLMKSALPRTDGTLLLTLISQLSLHEQLIKHNLLCICSSAPRSSESLLACRRRGSLTDTLLLSAEKQ